MVTQATRIRRQFFLALLVVLFVVSFLGVLGDTLGCRRVAFRCTPEACEKLKQTFRPVFTFEEDGIFTADMCGERILALPEGASVSAVPQAFAAVEALAPASEQAIPSAQIPWGIKEKYNDTSITQTSGGSGVVVAVLDTGFSSHPDLTTPSHCVDFTWSPPVEGQCHDGHGHGTHVTGTLLANGGPNGTGIYGMAPDVSAFMALKVLDDTGHGTLDMVVAAINYAVAHGANIINMSFGSFLEFEPLRNAVRNAFVNSSVVLVAAAGNFGPDEFTIIFPAYYKEVIAVASLKMIDNTTVNIDPDNLAVKSSSSRGCAGAVDSLGYVSGGVDCTVDMSGPGDRILSTYLNGGYAYASGTSMASPHVAGLAAKLWTGQANTTRQLLARSAARYDIIHTDGNMDTAEGYDIASGFGTPRFA